MGAATSRRVSRWVNIQCHIGMITISAAPLAMFIRIYLSEISLVQNRSGELRV
jgi:hypothetical protein